MAQPQNVLINLPSLPDTAEAAALATEVRQVLRSVKRLARATRPGRDAHAARARGAAAPIEARVVGAGGRGAAMSAIAVGPRLLRGGPLAAGIRETVAADVAAFRATYGHAPALAIVIAGRDAPSAVYLHKILDGCRQVGIADRLVELDADASPAHLRDVICSLNADSAVAGIIVQMPLPASLPLRTVIDALDPAKDIDGIHPLNAGLLALGYEGYLPATAHAAVEILTRSGIPLAGKRAVVVGRSNVVGKPAALLLLREHATVTICHSRTPDLAAEVRRGDVVIVAVGRPGLVTGEMLRPGAVVVDCRHQCRRRAPRG